jgi:hypothetical protein
MTDTDKTPLFDALGRLAHAALEEARTLPIGVDPEPLLALVDQLLGDRDKMLAERESRRP